MVVPVKDKAWTGSNITIGALRSRCHAVKPFCQQHHNSHDPFVAISGTLPVVAVCKDMTLASPTQVPVPVLPDRVTRLWLAHRAEEAALHLIPEAAQLCAELFQRLPEHEELVLLNRSPGIKNDEEARACQRALAETAFHLAFTGGSHTVRLNMMQLFQRIRLKAAFYDYLAIRLISQQPSGSQPVTAEIQRFHQARTEFSAAMDAIIQQLENRIEQTFHTCNATQYISLSAAKDIARIVLRQYVHETAEVPQSDAFSSEFLRRYQRRLAGLNVAD